MKCIECKRLSKIANTDESRQGICTYGNNWSPVCVDDECAYVPGPLTCKDCDRFGNDDACFTAQEDDSVMHNGEKCCGFIDIGEAQLYNILFQWALRGEDVEGKLKAVFAQFEDEFQEPFQPLV